MYKWNIDITLKGSGVMVKCRYDGPEMDTASVAKNLFHGKKPEDWIGFIGTDDRHNTFVVVGEIAAIDIYERRK